MELNDIVSVTLTKYGADFLNSKNKKERKENSYLREFCPKELVEKLRPIDYQEGTKLQESLWIILNWFGTCFNIGDNVPFTNLHTV